MVETSSLVVWLGVVSAVLVLALIAATIVIIWLICKLQQHEKDITNLHDGEKQAYENGLDKHGGRRSNRDSAIDMNEVEIRRPFSQTSAVSNVSNARKRMTIKIHKEEANVYGKTPPLGQVVMGAQNFYQRATNKTEPVPVENVDIVDINKVKKPVLSKLFTEDWRTGSPTSFLFNNKASSFEDILTESKGIFIHKMIGSPGGRLDISGVSLTIPSGALVEDTMVTLGVIWDDKVVPSLTKKQTILSPIVVCQPSGLKFKTTVTLSFPHAADQITTNWIPRIMKREGDLNAGSGAQWEPITLADYEERDVNKHRISLKLYHFTLYTLVGEAKPGKIASKLIHLVAFANKLQKGTFFKPRIFCMNKYKELEEIREKAVNTGSTTDLADSTELIVRDDEMDVIVELAKLSDGWQNRGDASEVLPFENVWHGFHPHCTFSIKQKLSSVSELICEFHAYQSGNDNQSAKLKIAELMEASSSPLSSCPEDPLEDLTRELTILLDPTSDVTGDWRSLAEHMGCSVTRIRWLAAQTSQTRVLLEKWVEDKRSFSELRQLLLDINRQDAAEEVSNRLSRLENETISKSVA